MMAPHRAREAIARRQVLSRSPVDLVILDLIQPREDCLSLCRELRTIPPALPGIFLTATGSEADRVVGLEMGTNYYLAKPFSTRELLARTVKKQ